LNRRILYWDIFGSQSIQNYSAPGSENALDVVPASHHHRRFWSGCKEGVLRCWDLGEQHPSGTVKKPLSEIKVGHKVWSLKTNGDLVVAGVYDKDPLRIFDARTSQRIGPVSSHRHSVYGIHLAEGSLMTTCSFDGSVALWDLRAKNAAPIMTLEDPSNEPIYCVQFDGHWKVISGTARWSGARLWDIRNQQAKCLFLNTSHTSSPIYSLHFDERRLCAGLAEQIVMLSLD